MKRTLFPVATLLVVISIVLVASRLIRAHRFEPSLSPGTLATEGCDHKCPNRPLGNEPYGIKPGDRTILTGPRFAQVRMTMRETAVTFATNYSPCLSDRGANDATGWLYETGIGTVN